MVNELIGYNNNLCEDNSFSKLCSVDQETVNLILSERRELPVTENYGEVEEEFFSRLKNYNISSDQYTVTVDINETILIDELFKKNVHDDTLLIISDCEHGAVVQAADRCKKVLTLSMESEIMSLDFSSLHRRLSEKDYKNVFVCIIGTSSATGEITPQYCFKALKNALDEKDINYKICIDDAQGLFTVKRDYSLFDYILATAHVIAPYYVMGILISKTGEVGLKVSNWLKKYIAISDVSKEVLQHFNDFNIMMTDYFTPIIAEHKGCFLPKHSLSPNVFSVYLDGRCIKDDWARRLENISRIHIENAGKKNCTMRIRLIDTITHAYYVKAGLLQVGSMMEQIKQLEDLRK